VERNLENKIKEQERKDKTRKEKLTPFSVKLVRSPVLYWAVQEGAQPILICKFCTAFTCQHLNQIFWQFQQCQPESLPSELCRCGRHGLIWFWLLLVSKGLT